MRATEQAEKEKGVQASALDKKKDNKKGSNPSAMDQGNTMLELTTKRTGTEQVTCSFCSGTGKDPFWIMPWISTCCTCGGKGFVTVRTPRTKCGHCKGAGAIKTFTCTVCMGTGWVRLSSEPTAVCPEWQGSGDDQSPPAMACLK